MAQKKEGNKKALFSRRETQAISNSKQGISWFLGIGINNYKHFPKLNNAVKDVEDILSLLQSKYEVDNAFTIWNETATRKEIIKALDQLADTVGPNDKLIIYYSGHGHLDKFNKGFWVPTDAEKDNTAHYIRNSTIRDYIENINSRHLLLISDSCFSGSLFVEGKQRTSLAADKLEQKKSRWAFCSGRHDEEAYDGPPGTNSPFASSILKVLTENDLFKLTSSKLAYQVMELTTARYRQLPIFGRLFGVGDEGGQYVFVSKRSEDVIWANAIAEHSIEAFNAYLEKFPQGKYSEDASQRIDELDRKKEESTYSAKDIVQNNLSIKETSYREKTTSDLKTKFGNFTDPRDSKTYKTLEINNKVWMAENLKFKTEDSRNYNNDLKNGEKYGRLYTWEAAQKACPPGWQVPSDEDWKALTAFFGGYFDLVSDRPFGEFGEAYEALVEGGISGFNALKGGLCSQGKFSGLEEMGSYWSSDGIDNDKAIGYAFHNGVLSRNYYNRSLMRSCRCIKQFPDNQDRQNVAGQEDINRQSENDFSNHNFTQNAEKIYNINKIDKADFS